MKSTAKLHWSCKSVHLKTKVQIHRAKIKKVTLVFTVNCHSGFFSPITLQYLRAAVLVTAPCPSLC